MDCIYFYDTFTKKTNFPGREKYLIFLCWLMANKSIQVIIKLAYHTLSSFRHSRSIHYYFSPMLLLPSLMLLSIQTIMGCINLGGGVEEVYLLGGTTI